jgi:hypothetical protein
MLRCPWSLVVIFSLALGLSACEEESDMTPSVDILSVLLNSSQLSSGATEVPLDAELELVFSRGVDPNAFEEAFSLQPQTDLSFSYSQQSARVTIEAMLQTDTEYTLSIVTEPIGRQGERLMEPVTILFRTRPEGVIRSMPPCTQATADCLRTTTLSRLEGEGTFSFYSSFPVYEELASWEELTSALIMVHGLNRNADDYFQYLMSTLQSEELESEVALIAPYFREDPRPSSNDIHWSGNGWREGQSSSDGARMSSFYVVDQLINQLADRDRFPVLENVIIVGQSSGGLFVHTYAAGTRIEEQHPHLQFSFVTGESQYFYYPDGRRVNEATGQLFTPGACTGYDIWPLGIRSAPAYVSAQPQESVNEQFLQRNLIYLLGNGSGSDGALNTTECRATLLGSSRYQRGENMMTYLNEAFPGQHNHRKVIAQGITHDGSRIYQSSEFRSLLNELLE